MSDLGVRLVVDREGMYRVTYEDLRAAGFDLADVPASRLVLTNRGRAVPTWVGPTSQLSAKGFGPGSFLVFWGEGVTSLYTNENVYRLRVDPAATRTAMTVDLRGPDLGTRPAETYLETLRIDTNRGYSFSSPTGDPWYDTRLLAYTKPVQSSFTLDVADLAPAGAARLSVGLWGSTDWPDSPDHHVVVTWNGQPVADELFDGIANRPLSIALDRSQLKAGTNQLGLTLPGDTGVAYDLVMLDTYGLTYPRLLKARENRLVFESQASELAVDGFTAPDVYVFRRPAGGADVQMLTSVLVERSGVGYRARFHGSSSASSDRYQVATGASFLRPRIEPGRAGVDLVPATRDVTMLVVAHPDFTSRTAASPRRPVEAGNHDPRRRRGGRVRAVLGRRRRPGGHPGDGPRGARAVGRPLRASRRRRHL